MNLSEKAQSLALAEHYFRSNNYEFAEGILKTIIKAEPSNSKANELLAYIYGNQGDFEASHLLLELSCKSNDCAPEALYYLGSAQLKKHQYEKAANSFKQSIEKAGTFFEALHDLGTTYGFLGKIEDALSCYQECLKFNSSSPELYFNIAKCLDDLKRHQEALTNYDRAIKLKPNYVEAIYNKGITLHDLGYYEEAISHYDQAIQLKPDYAEAWSNKGVTLHDLKRYQEALTHYDQAIQLKPDYFEIYWNKSLIHLVLDNLIEGWNLYSYRWKRKNSDQYRNSQFNELNSLKNIGNKNILIWHEQGLGDTIQFSRYIPKIIERGAHVTFEVQPSLLNIMSNQFNCITTSDIDKKKAFDYQIPLLELPKIFGTDTNNIPAPINIKLANTDLLQWKNKLNLSTKKLNIGIAISGNPNHKNDKNRSIPIEKIKPLLTHGQFFLLQKDIKSEDKKFLDTHPEIINLSPQIDSLHDTASIIQNMDLIISVDTSLIHLAGSLHKKSYLMLPWCAEWRWLLNRSDSPWYPSIEIFRQKSLRDWNSVISQIKSKLERGL